MPNSQKKIYQCLVFSVIALLITRLLIIIFLPLMDTTEARYSEMVRIMVETKDWFVLQFDYNIPFWGKPPLFAWLSALSIKLLGLNEFALRLPAYLLQIALVWIVGTKIFQLKTYSFWLFAFIMFSSLEFLIHMGVVSTDVSFNFAIALSMLAAWKVVQGEDRNKIWFFLFFTMTGLGMLAKGPTIFILVGPPIFIWLLLHRRWSSLPQSPLWLALGFLLFLAISVPWYLAAEQHSPGFLDYFLVGEHFDRFLVPDWQGDKYGNAHHYPLGTIWWFLISMLSPWVVYVLIRSIFYYKELRTDRFVSFLLIWMLWTPIFFSLSRNVLHTYILPSAVPCALLAVHWLKKEKPRLLHALIALGSVVTLICTVLACLLVFFMPTIRPRINTDKFMTQHVPTNAPIYFWKNATFSGRFYTNGKISLLKNDSMLQQHIQANKSFYLLLHKGQLNEIDSITQKYTAVDSNYKRILLKVN